jgi:hypothetical protein
MTSQKKIESNRRNGRKGRRPRSTKSRSRLNAHKHGLSLPIMANHELQAEALKLAHAIAGEGADNALLEQALSIAECELDLQRVQEARRVTLEHEMRHEKGAAAVDKFSRYSAEQQFCFGAYVRAMPTLKQIERYERRVYSRRDKAMVRLHGQKLLTHCLAKQR